MRKFDYLCEEYSPESTQNPKWALIDFLKSKGINVSLVKDTDMLYIDTGNQSIAVTVSNNEEEAENVQAGVGNYQVNNEVEKLANTAKSGLQGQAAKLFGTSAQQAKGAVQDRSNVTKQAVGVYKKDTSALKNAMRNYSRNSVNITQ